MARIRSIKPEFPMSESMGNLSRDARLCFILLWTICDDEGRTRAHSRMLANALFPYDSDAVQLIDGWLAELKAEKCIVLYEHDGKHYLQVLNWLKHQRVDKPYPSKIPPFQEQDGTIPRTFANIPSRNRNGIGEEKKELEDARASGEEKPEPTAGALACQAMAKGGVPITQCNPRHPDLLAALAEGATFAEFEATAREFAGKGKGFAYVVKTIRGRKAEVAAPVKPPEPKKPKYFERGNKQPRGDPSLVGQHLAAALAMVGGPTNGDDEPEEAGTEGADWNGTSERTNA